MAIFTRKKVIVSVLVFIILLIILFFIARTFIFNKILEKTTSKLHNYYKLELRVENSGLNGLSGLWFKNITIKDSLNDTVFYSDNLNLNIKVLPLLFGNIRLNTIISNKISIKFTNGILESILNSNKKQKTDSTQLRNYSKAIDNVFNALFSMVPDNVQLDSFSFKYNRPKSSLEMFCKSFKIDNNNFNIPVWISDSLSQSNVQLQGNISESSKSFKILITSTDNKPITMPYIGQRWGINVKFDTLQFGINYLGYSSEKVSFTGNTQTFGFEIQNKKISPEPVGILKGGFDFNISAGKNYIELDSSSVLSLNNFSFSPYVKYENSDSKKLIISIPKKEFEAQQLFESFPTGLFTSIRDMKVSGTLTYELKFNVDFKEPDSLKFYSRLDKNDFKIIHYGAANLGMLNDTFIHSVYERDQAVYRFLVGPQNPDYVPLDKISDFLKYSVLTSEDGDFFYNKGFNEESFRTSIVTNIKQKRFARGGSTITMQLVKNVFLTRNKAISRKLEEVFIVWMIENLHLVSKDRMFEVYLNIIEWGPGIYGIKPAAKFYFKKKPSQLKLNEAIYLASIIPSPKYFKYTFKQPNVLTDYYAWFYKRLPDVMVRRNQILPSDTVGLKAEVKITGIAKRFLTKPDSLKVDSTFFNDEPIFFIPEEN